jgi:hypothetical protein
MRAANRADHEADSIVTERTVGGTRTGHFRRWADLPSSTDLDIPSDFWKVNASVPQRIPIANFTLSL